MVFRLLADLVVAVHFLFIIFIAVGALLAWRWPGLCWLHVPAFIYGAVIITVGFTCPLTPLEKHLRRLGGEHEYSGGFIDHYIKGVIYPKQLNWLAQALIAAAVVVGYTGLLLRRRRAPAKADGPAGHAAGRPSAEARNAFDGTRDGPTQETLDARARDAGARPFTGGGRQRPPSEGVK